MDGLLAYSLASGGSQANRATGVACLLAASALSSPAAARSKRADRLFLVMGLVAPARSSRACGAGSCARCVFCKEASTVFVFARRCASHFPQTFLFDRYQNTSMRYGEPRQDVKHGMQLQSLVKRRECFVGAVSSDKFVGRDN
eukprot:TRINITY_DN2593_c0_g1_i4.p1 TRINITY_DN2593_c0_g1~~TRINITY_DN2593_c0_g1_i4.p1  ORF type:complete len:143 (+),score=10.93 TRINITY_DN2593_c0_g1_i4:38-466(+)